MERPSVTLREDQNMADALKAFAYYKVSAIPVLKQEGSKIAGVITQHQVVEKIAWSSDLSVTLSGLLEPGNFHRIDIDASISIDDDLTSEVICVCKNDELAGIIDTLTILNIYKWKVKLLSRFEELSKEYAMILNHCYDSIYEISPEGIVLFANPATERISARRPEQVIGKTVQSIENEKIFFPSVLSSVLKQKQTVTILQNVKGTDKAVVTAVPVLNKAGEVYRVIAVTRDINMLIDELERFPCIKETEEMIKRLQEKERLAEECFKAFRQMQKEQMEEKKITTKNREMGKVLDMVKRVAPVNSNVLILGESGVGKDLIATLIHNLSEQRDGPFVKINCGAIPAGILESELFGYEGGAFTGAQNKGKMGLFEIADGGTVFLNEIGEMPLNLQVKLLQVIQDKNLIRVGGTSKKEIDIRIIAASNKDLSGMVKDGTFREDLFYRLNVVSVTIPPLRNRKEDIPDLVMEFMDKFNKKYRRTKQLSSHTMKILLNYNWPGNVRELENLIERIIVVSRDNIIYPDDLPPNIYHSVNESLPNLMFFPEDISLQQAVDIVEKYMIQNLYQRYKSTNKVAEVLKINQSTVVRKLKKYKLSSGDEPS